MTAREVLLAWAKSPGFAAIHNGQATDEQIVDDLIAYLRANDFAVEPSPGWMAPYPPNLERELKETIA